MAIPILMPRVDPYMRAGRLTRWLRHEGEFVRAGDPIAEIATERATMDVEAPHTGVLAHIFIEAGAEDIAVDRQIGVIEPGVAPHRPPRSEDAPAPSARVGRTAVSPRARRLAREAGFDLAGLSGGGPNGRIVEKDVRAALETHDKAARPEEPREFEGPRLHSLLGAAQWAPLVHLEVDCRVDALRDFRAELNDVARSNGTARISLVDCVIKALAGALQRTPAANVAFAPDGYTPAKHSDVALALSIGGRVVAPALPAAENMSLAEIAAARADFMAAHFSPAAFFGGSSLVANFGAFEIKRVLPVVVSPWTSVLAIGAPEKRVIVEDGAPAIATMLSVALAVDRRAMDEVAAASLLAAFKRLIEEPHALIV